MNHALHTACLPLARRPVASLVVVVMCLVELAAVPASAQRIPGDPNGARPTRAAPGLDRISVDEQLDRPLDLDLAFRDHNGRTVHLRDYFTAGKPVLLTFAYHSCPVLCSMVLDATGRAINEAEWTPGDEYIAVTISIDPRDTVERAAQKRAEVLQRLNESREGRAPLGDGWHFLVGDQDNITAATEAAGYNYFYDQQQGEYAHPATIMFLTPQGNFARYLYGLEFDPSDFRFALLESSQGRSISATEHFLMACYSYDASQHTYTANAKFIMKLGGLTTIAILGGFLIFFWRRERRRARSEADSRQQASRTSATPELANQVQTS